MNSKIETFFAGLIYVSIGTIVAIQVNAAGKSESCSPTEAPDAMCSVAVVKGPESKLCFGSGHPRCFEIKESRLVQTLNGQIAQNVQLKPSELATVRGSIDRLTTWLETSLKTKPASHSTCREVITYDAKNSHKEFCISKIAKNDVDSKTRDTLLTLEHPAAASSGSSSGSSSANTH